MIFCKLNIVYLLIYAVSIFSVLGLNDESVLVQKKLNISLKVMNGETKYKPTPVYITTGSPPPTPTPSGTGSNCPCCCEEAEDDFGWNNSYFDLPWLDQEDAFVCATLAYLSDDITLSDCYAMNDIKDQAWQWTYDNFGPGKPLQPTHNSNGTYLDNGADAARHAYWNCLMKQYFDQNFTEEEAEALAQIISFNHERFPGNYGNCSQNYMDLYNNVEGLNIGSSEDCGQKVLAMLANGELMTSPAEGNGGQNPDGSPAPNCN